KGTDPGRRREAPEQELFPERGDDRAGDELEHEPRCLTGRRQRTGRRDVEDLNERDGDRDCGAEDVHAPERPPGATTRSPNRATYTIVGTRTEASRPTGPSTWTPSASNGMATMTLRI